MLPDERFGDMILIFKRLRSNIYNDCTQANKLLQRKVPFHYCCCHQGEKAQHNIIYSLGLLSYKNIAHNNVMGMGRKGKHLPN